MWLTLNVDFDIDLIYFIVEPNRGIIEVSK